MVFGRQRRARGAGPIIDRSICLAQKTDAFHRERMTLDLDSHPLCPFVHRAAIMLHEKGVPFDRRNVDLKNKPDWFLALSPRGKVPVLVADGVSLFESAAICEFLDETQPPRLIAA